jgi:Plasmid pRiA4b ORF-3-like protein
VSLPEPGDKLFYEYDFADGWHHTLRLEAILPQRSSASQAACIARRRDGPPEDCGGVGGYELMTVATDAGHPHHGDAVAEFAHLYGGADLNYEEYVDAAQGDRAVDVKEVACQHRRGLRAQELPPGGPGALWRGRYPRPSQHSPHRGGSDPVPEAEQLALDPFVAPARVLPRHLLDQHHEFGIDGRPSCLGRIGPPPVDQAPVPAQQRVRR